MYNPSVVQVLGQGLITIKVLLLLIINYQTQYMNGWYKWASHLKKEKKSIHIVFFYIYIQSSGRD